MKGLFLGWSSFSGRHPKVVVILLPSRTNHLKQYPSVSQDPSLHTSAWLLFDSEVELHFRISLWNSKFSSLGVQSSWILLSCADLSLAEPSSWFKVPQTQCLKPENKIKDLVLISMFFTLWNQFLNLRLCLLHLLLIHVS